ncbi:hypothetical protein [Brevundimonas sp. LjRoot202]|uniref:hypothetical protein n=1 Tax=Brevundimonas sp. LjRoot202 TaxID=3342281 RepID=UPI003ECCEA1D
MPLTVAGRQIVESGSAVLGTDEHVVTISLDNLKFEIQWINDGGEQKVVAEDIAPGAIRLKLMNAELSLGATYVAPNAGTYAGKQLGFSIFWQSMHGDLGVSRFFSYMLTVR